VVEIASSDKEACAMAEFSRTSVFSPMQVRMEGMFRKGRVVVVFAPGTIDLAATQLGPEGADLHVVAVFGNVDVKAPAGARGVSSGTAAFGRFAEMERPSVADPAAPALRLSGVTVFGNIRVS
jgi:hypothetical protein